MIDTDMADTVLSALIVPLNKRSSHTGIFLDADNEAPSFLSYPDLYQRVMSAAQGFRRNGIGKGSRVMLPFSTSRDCIVAFLALIGIGALPLSVKTPAAGGNAQEYAQFLHVLVSRFGASAVIDVPGLEKVHLPVPRVAVLAENSDAGPIDWTMPSADDTAFVQFSSGTTSEPKGVPIQHGQLIRQLQMIVSQDGRTMDDVGASWLPLYHDMGLIGALLTPMYAGHNLHLCTPSRFLMDPIDWLCLLSEQGVSVTALPNFGMAYLLKRLQEPELDLQAVRLDRLRRIYLGSDAIDASIVTQLSQRLAAHGLSENAFTPCYGMAEAVLMVSCKQRDTALRVSGKAHAPVVSVGPILEGFQLKITRDDGALVDAGESGELWLRGGTLSERYFEDERPLLDPDGFYRTGDIGYVEEEELYITGRIGERIKINGQNYYLSHLENALQAHPELRSGGVAVIQSGGDLTVLAEPARFGSSERLYSLRAELSQLLLSKTGVKVPAER
ncbi:MAG TPA: AMP-binding protein, partial [Noviherbaspirillum sp.]|nr:AMP-binding protein [Noviherbaspirillum sp.]